ncbi:MAG: hypothetical protein ACRCS0_07925, partial [Albidovulum sp.]
RCRKPPRGHHRRFVDEGGGIAMQTRLSITLAERDGRLVPGLTLPGVLGAEALLLGRTPEDAVGMLGRLFNLCRHAQEGAARLAFGLPVPAGDGIRAEILRDTLFRLFVGLPRAMGRAPKPLPSGWQNDPKVVARALFGTSGRFPERWPEFLHWLAGTDGLAPLLAMLNAMFAPGEAASRVLPFASADDGPCENSAAMRHAGHPVLDRIESGLGRGPLWRSVARMLDAEACLNGWQPAPRLVAPGLAEAPSARGLYRIGVSVSAGRVTAVRRRTPTDDFCHRDGPMLSALSTLPPVKRHLAPIVVECFDPCLPWAVREMADA